jgi:protein-tyrosine-phosphatase
MKVIGGLALLAVTATAGEPEATGPTHSADVVFVCAHGNVKSLIAAEWFNRLAMERGIAARSVARGLTPENPVPLPIVDRLRRDGIDVTGYEARALEPADLEKATRLVLIGVEAPVWAKRDGLRVESWEGIPPASERYEASRDAMRTRIEGLLAARPKGERTP